jgi:hypothetical protein
MRAMLDSSTSAPRARCCGPRCAVDRPRRGPSTRARATLAHRPAPRDAPRPPEQGPVRTRDWPFARRASPPRSLQLRARSRFCAGPCRRGGSRAPSQDPVRARVRRAPTPGALRAASFATRADSSDGTCVAAQAHARPTSGTERGNTDAQRHDGSTDEWPSPVAGGRPSVEAEHGNPRATSGRTVSAMGHNAAAGRDGRGKFAKCAARRPSGLGPPPWLRACW